MAIVDLATGKIHGCKEGSRVWFHEQGHIVFNNSEWGAKISYYQTFFMMVAVFTGSLSLLIPNLLLRVFTFMNALGMLLSYIFEELWAWGYSFRHYNR
jgi:hypothetical protein